MEKQTVVHPWNTLRDKNEKNNVDTEPARMNTKCVIPSERSKVKESGICVH